MSEIHVCNAAMLHTIQRHKEILKDYRIEFNKTRSNFLAKRARDELLQNDSNGKNYDSDNGMNRRDYYFKENQHIYNSDSLINDQISIAIEARDHLISQRHTFKRIQTRFNDVSNRFPAINSLMQRVNLRKRRDSIILGLLVAFCTLLMLLYVFH